MILRRHPKAALPEDISPLTFEEFVHLVPANVPPPPVLDILIQYRVLIEAQLPRFTQIVTERGVALKAKGINVPSRFLPNDRPSREAVLTVAAELYRRMLSERYA